VGIGRTHRYAAELDGQYHLLAGAFSRDQSKNKAIAKELGIAPDRVYPDLETMADKESRRSDGIQCASVVTPNNSHAAISIAFMTRSIHVICDKPISTSFADAVKVMKSAEKTGSGHRGPLIPLWTTNKSSRREIELRIRQCLDGFWLMVWASSYSNTPGMIFMAVILWR
jgi:hypothetical protein